MVAMVVVVLVVVVVVVVYVCMSVCLCLPVAGSVRTVGHNGVARLGSLSTPPPVAAPTLQWSSTGFLDNTSLAF